MSYKAKYKRIKKQQVPIKNNDDKKPKKFILKGTVITLGPKFYDKQNTSSI